jgi:hypothetical protein
VNTFNVVVPRAPHAEVFRETAEALAEALRDLGYDAEVTRDEGNARSIIMGPHLLNAPPAPGSILYNLEQCTSQLFVNLLPLFRKYETWDYSPHNAVLLRELGCRAKHVDLGYSPCLTRIAPAPKTIDVLFAGSRSERRARVIAELQAMRLGVRLLFGCYGAERDRLIASARVVLCMFFYDPPPVPLGRCVRCTYMAANGACIVAEECACPCAPLVPLTPYHELASECRRLAVGHQAVRDHRGEVARETLARMPLTDILREALSPVSRGTPASSLPE